MKLALKLLLLTAMPLLHACGSQPIQAACPAFPPPPQEVTRSVSQRPSITERSESSDKALIDAWQTLTETLQKVMRPTSTQKP